MKEGLGGVTTRRWCHGVIDQPVMADFMGYTGEAGYAKPSAKEVDGVSHDEEETGNSAKTFPPTHIDRRKYPTQYW